VLSKDLLINKGGTRATHVTGQPHLSKSLLFVSQSTLNYLHRIGLQTLKSAGNTAPQVSSRRVSNIRGCTLNFPNSDPSAYHKEGRSVAQFPHLCQQPHNTNTTLKHASTHGKRDWANWLRSDVRLLPAPSFTSHVSNIFLPSCILGTHSAHTTPP
jgi:hypothetical protein